VSTGPLAEVVLTYVVFRPGGRIPGCRDAGWVFDIKGGRIVWTASAPEGLRGVRVGLLLLVVCTLDRLSSMVRLPALRKRFLRPVRALPPEAQRDSAGLRPSTRRRRSRSCPSEHDADKEPRYFRRPGREVLNLLAHVPSCGHRRASSFAFKGKPMEIAEIATKLGVSKLLEGSVRKSGAVLRVTAQLIRASDSSQSGRATYDRELTDVFRVQDEIAAAVWPRSS